MSKKVEQERRLYICEKVYACVHGNMVGGKDEMHRIEILEICTMMSDWLRNATDTDKRENDVCMHRMLGQVGTAAYGTSA